MSYQTRQQQIEAGKWPTTTVPTEQGDIRLAKPSADGSMRVRAMHRRAAIDESVELESMATMLEVTCVDAKGAPLFANLASAKAFLGVISTETLTAMITAAGKLAAPPPADGDPGNSGAGPS